MSQQDSQSSERSVTVREALAICGSGDHDQRGKNFQDLRTALSEAHPAVAGKLLDHLTTALDENDPACRGTSSGTEHPDWHSALDRAKSNSLDKGYD